MLKKLGIGCAVVGAVLVVLVMALVVIAIAVDDDSGVDSNISPSQASAPDEAMSSQTQNSGSVDSLTASVESPTPIAVTARQLNEDYERNEVAADAKYVGNYVMVTGVIYSVTEAVGKYDVKLETDDFISVTNIVCKVDKDEEATILTLAAGDTVTVLGNVSGKSVFDINLRDCSLVPTGR